MRTTDAPMLTCHRPREAKWVPMIQITYVSSAVRPMSETELFGLLREARSRNQSMDVTGLLLYRGGNFIQSLEGPEAAVETIYKSIKADPRHEGKIELDRRLCDERSFPVWSMGFQTQFELTAQLTEAFPGFLSESMTTEMITDRSDEVLGLLQLFRHHNRP